jgi:hypothetical protein
MVQMDDVRHIRDRWEAAGSQSCEHQDVEKEYYLGSQTGDFVCTRCGKTFGSDPTAKRNDPKDSVPPSD